MSICLWTLAGLLGAAKAVRAGYKIVKLAPKLLTFLDKVKDAKKRRDALRAVAQRRKKKKDRDSCESTARRNSFLPGTPVLLPGGASTPIEELKVGDPVLATDPATGVTAAKPVTDTIVDDGEKKLVDLTIDTDGHRGDETATITATHNHPFWVPTLAEWVDAEHLAPQQWLRTSAGTHVQITAVRHHNATTRVHNLTIADIHTYYVLAGNKPLLVHNNNRGADDCDTVTVYRVEGAGNERVRIHDDCSVLIRGVNEKTLFLNFGDRARAEEFRNMHLAAYPDTAIKSFKVKREFLEYLQEDAVPERLSRRFPTRPIAVDLKRKDGTPSRISMA